MPSRPKKRASRRKKPKGGPTRAELKHFRAKLVAQRARILQSTQTLEEEALKGAGEDYSVEHMADAGTDNFDQACTLTLLEGEAGLLRDVNRALAKIDGRLDLPYGLCENCLEEPPEEGSEHRCGTCPWIAKGRLEAVPHARLCVSQQELEEEKEGA